MIPVQKSFPPSLLRRWRKVMRETPKENDWTPVQYNDPLQQHREYSADWILEQLSDPVKAAKLKDAGWDLKSLQFHAETANHMRSHLAFKKWKLSQDRAKLIYILIASAVLALIAFVVTNGGCR